MVYRYYAEPHPHLLVNQIVSPDDYRAMRFPDEHITAGASWGLTSTDSEYEKVLEDARWRELRDTLCGQPFVHGVLKCFAGDMRQAGCLVDPDRARLTPFAESREGKEKARDTLVADGDPNELFTRLDFQSKGSGGYRE